MAGLCAPLPTLRLRPRERKRTAWGRCGSLLLHRIGLAPITPCRSPGAQSPQLQEVCANPRDFLLYRIARHFRRLPTPFPGLPAPSCHAKPYVRRNKSDQVDAAAIYEAMSRPGQRFMPVRSVANQAELMHHRARELLAGRRTAAVNALRGHLAEIGLIAPQGAHHAYGLKRMAVDGFNENGEIVVPDCVRGALRSLVGQIDALDEAAKLLRRLSILGRDASPASGGLVLPAQPVGEDAHHP